MCGKMCWLLLKGETTLLLWNGRKWKNAPVTMEWREHIILHSSHKNIVCTFHFWSSHISTSISFYGKFSTTITHINQFIYNVNTMTHHYNSLSTNDNADSLSTKVVFSFQDKIIPIYNLRLSCEIILVIWI